MAHRYFSGFYEDYHRAFEGKGENLLHRIINILFRRETFEKRAAVVKGFLEAHGVAGKRLLDLGCGSGEVSLMAARLGARVTGLDVVEGMVATARRQARESGLEGVAEFHAADVTSALLPPSDITLIVSVCEYYTEIADFLTRACDATGELLVIVDAGGPWWRRALRYTLAWFKRFHICYRSPEEFAAIVTRAGFAEKERFRGHSFWALSFRRAPQR